MGELGLYQELPAVVKHAKLRPEEEIARLRVAMEDHERNVAQLKREKRWDLENRFALDTLLRERRRALRWLLGVARSYADASPDEFIA